MDQTITAAAVVLNHNDNVKALKTIDTFVKTKVIKEIAVLDNSTKNGLNGSEAELNSEKVIFRRIYNCGYATGNNIGLNCIIKEMGLPDYFIISNPDIEISEDAIIQSIEFLQNHIDYAVASPHEMNPDGTPHHLAGWKERTLICDLAYSSGILSRLIGMYRETYPDAYWKTDYSTVHCITGAFFIIKAEIFSQVGFFDNHTFLFYEEDILASKLKEIGYKEAILNTCSYIHHEGVSAGRNVNYLKKYRIMQSSRLYFHRKYKKVNALEFFLLCLATGLGFAENIIKTIIFSNRDKRGR